MFSQKSKGLRGNSLLIISSLLTYVISKKFNLMITPVLLDIFLYNSENFTSLSFIFTRIKNTLATVLLAKAAVFFVYNFVPFNTLGNFISALNIVLPAACVYLSLVNKFWGIVIYTAWISSSQIFIKNDILKELTKSLMSSLIGAICFVLSIFFTNLDTSDDSRKIINDMQRVYAKTKELLEIDDINSPKIKPALLEIKGDVVELKGSVNLFYLSPLQVKQANAILESIEECCATYTAIHLSSSTTINRNNLLCVCKQSLINNLTCYEEFFRDIN